MRVLGRCILCSLLLLVISALIISLLVISALVISLVGRFSSSPSVGCFCFFWIRGCFTIRRLHGDFVPALQKAIRMSKYRHTTFGRHNFSRIVRSTHHVTRVNACDCSRKKTECSVLAIYTSRGAYFEGHTVRRMKL